MVNDTLDMLRELAEDQRAELAKADHLIGGLAQRLKHRVTFCPRCKDRSCDACRGDMTLITQAGL